jgi:hypothetical protein
MSESFSFLQLVVLVFLLAGFNYWGILADSLRRKTKQDERKKFWRAIYLFTAAFSSLPLIERVPSSLIILPVTGVAAAVLMFAYMARLSKSVLPEMITFSAFSFGSLMAINPAAPPEWDNNMRLWAVMTLYFCLSIFIVKIRLEKLNPAAAVAYAVSAMILLLLYFGIEPAVAMVSALMAMRLIPALFAPEWYRSINIKYIGISEALFQVAFIAVLLFFFR